VKPIMWDQPMPGTPAARRKDRVKDAAEQPGDHDPSPGTDGPDQQLSPPHDQRVDQVREHEQQEGKRDCAFHGFRTVDADD